MRLAYSRSSGRNRKLDVRDEALSVMIRFQADTQAEARTLARLGNLLSDRWGGKIVDWRDVIIRFADELRAEKDRREQEAHEPIEGGNTL